MLSLLGCAACRPAWESSGEQGSPPGANVTSALPAATALKADDAWPLFRGDPQASGVARGTLPEKLELLWTFSVEGGGFDATAAIADGMVYAGCLDGKLLRGAGHVDRVLILQYFRVELIDQQPLLFDFRIGNCVARGRIVTQLL